MLSILIGVIVAGLIVWLLMWAVDYIGIPEPFHKVAKVIIVVIAVVYLLSILMPFVGGSLK